MVYRLACPSCSAVVEHPFVRAGAVAVCSDCRTVWRVEAGHITRSMTAACVEEKTDPDPEVDIKTSEAPRRSPGSSGAGDTAIVGLSGLSDVMRRGSETDEAGDAASGSDAAPPPQGRTPTRSPAAAFMPPSKPQAPGQRRSLEAARRRRRRTLLVLFMALTVMVGTLGVSVALLAAKQRAAEEAQAQLDNPNQTTSRAVSPPLRPAQALGLDDALLSSRGRNDVRAVAEPGNDTALLMVRLIATEDAPPSPIELIITATTDGRITHAWTLTEPRALTRQQGLRLYARLPGAPDNADPAGWIVTATANAPGN